MYEDILGEVDRIREIKNRKFDLKEEITDDGEEFGIFEELAVEFDYE